MSTNTKQAIKEREHARDLARQPIPFDEPEPPKPKKAKKAKPVVIEPEPATVTEADAVDAVVEGPEPIEAYTG